MKGFAHRRGLGAWVAAGFAVVTLGAAVPAARADAIDNALLEKGRAIMKYLRKKENKDVKNVGVLKFQVQVRGGKPSMEVGRLNSLMETRLENVLILANEDDDSLIGITRGASQVAAGRDKKATYLTADGRAKLFAQSYPLAWGKEQVKVDRFLTGVVQTSKDLKKTTVIIHAYAPGRAEPQEVTRFTVPTDRLLLADLNQGFFLQKRELAPTVEYDQGDIAAVLNAGGGGDKAAPPKDDPNDTFDKVLDFKVFYDDNPVAQKGDAKHTSVETPRKGQNIKFILKARERVGVVLLVNGVNTLGQEEDEREPDQYSMWVLEPGKEYTIKGYYTTEKGKGANGSDFKEFKVLSESESVLAELANESKAGKIELFVFRGASGKALQGQAPPPSNLRTESGRAETLPAIRAQVAREVARPRGILVPNPIPEKGPEIPSVPFNGVLAGHRAITYYQTPR